MRLVPLLAIPLLAALSLAACASSPMPVESDTVTFVVVRHAEKQAGADPDPALTAPGEARARALAAALEDAPVVAVYATGYARTQQTARPTADRHGLAVATYDAREPADAFAARLRATHDHGTVLVVGHSNTVPGIAAALCGCEVPAMDESEYDRRLVVAVAADGRATLATDRQPAPGAQ